MAGKMLLSELKVADLKRELEERDLESSGKKSVLLDRLREALLEEGVDPDTHRFETSNHQIMILQESFSSLKGELQESFSSLKGKLQESFSSLEGKLQESFSSLKGELQESISSLRSELQGNITSSLKSELQENISSLKGYNISRFFATGSDSESEISSEEEPTPRAPAPAFTFSDEEEDTKHVVCSAKEKRYEDLMNTIKQIRNFKKTKDMSSMLSSFEDLMRAYTKAIPVINKEENYPTPRFYLRCLVELEDFISEVWEDREGRKNMSKNNSKSFSSLRQKLRKYNKDFEEDIAKFRENPDVADVDEEQPKKVDDDFDDETEMGVNFKKSGFESSAPDKRFLKGPSADDNDGSDSSMDWDDDSDSSSSDSTDDIPGMSIRDRFLKSSYRNADKDNDERKKARCDEEEDYDDEGPWVAVRGRVALPSKKPKMFLKGAEVDITLVVKKLNEIVAARSKKRTDHHKQIDLLRELQTIADRHHLGVAIDMKIKLAIISSIFDYNLKVSDAMKSEYWAKLLERISERLDLLMVTPEIMIDELVTDENENLEKPPYHIHGCILTMVERLHEKRSSYNTLRDQMQHLGLKKFGIPRLGCGYDGLDGKKVDPMLQEVFGSTDIQVDVCVFNPWSGEASGTTNC